MTKEIQLANGKGVTLVDNEDYEWLSRYSWCINSCGHAVANVDGRNTLMHRLILRLTDPKIDTVDTVVDGIKALKRNGFLHVKQNEQGGLERNYTTYRLNGRFLW